MLIDADRAVIDAIRNGNTAVWGPLQQAVEILELTLDINNRVNELPTHEPTHQGTEPKPDGTDQKGTDGTTQTGSDGTTQTGSGGTTQTGDGTASGGGGTDKTTCQAGYTQLNEGEDQKKC
jgi:hypothetical protein